MRPQQHRFLLWTSKMGANPSLVFYVTKTPFSKGRDVTLDGKYVFHVFTSQLNT